MAGAPSDRNIPLTRILLILAALAAAPVCAQPLVTASQLDLMLLLPPPPAEGSTADKAEMADILALQAARTPAQAAATVHDAGETVFDMYAGQLGPRFTPAALPLCSALFERIGDTEEEITDPPKKGFHRPRPFQANAEVHPSAPLSKSGSYPSGHATRVTMTAIVLAAMLPEQRDMIFSRAMEYAENRRIGGVHYESDLSAGERAGTAAAALFMNDPSFQAAFTPARAELRAALGQTG